jgi:hypothetical protein
VQRLHRIDARRPLRRNDARGERDRDERRDRACHDTHVRRLYPERLRAP